MSGRTVVHLLRHGEVHNPEGVFYGRLPGYRLSGVGQRQAELLAEHLADHGVVHVAASPLQRAQQTAEPIAARHGAAVATDERLIEAANLFEGQQVSVGSGALRYLRHWPKLRNPFRPSWGEPYTGIAQRMLAAVHRARDQAAGHEAVCVSHQLPIWTLRRHLAGQRLWHHPRRRRCALGSLTSLVFAGEALAEVVYTEPLGRSDPRVTRGMRRVAGLLVAALLVLAGCSTGTGAVARGGTFELVSPGGRTEIFYEPPAARGTVRGLSGDSLLEPGRSISLEQFRGQVVVLNIWGSWCGPCRSEAGDLQRVAEATAGDGVALLGIDVRDSRDAATDFVRNYGLAYPSIFDPPGRSLFALGGVPRSVVPLTVVLDRRHRVAAVFLRELLAADLLPVVQRLATEP